MIKKVIIILIVIPLACSSPPATDDELMVPAAQMLISEGVDMETMRLVNGIVFKVEDFDKWMNVYGKIADGLIIAFRNVDAPDMTLIFEGQSTLEAALERTETLTSEDFLAGSSAYDDPITSYYEIAYVDTVANPPNHFFALSYSSGGDIERNWPAFVRDNMAYFKELGLEPSGIGTDPRQADRGYLLFRQYDFIALRKTLNSPRKINKFLERLELPDQTLISYWVRISE